MELYVYISPPLPAQGRHSLTQSVGRSPHICLMRSMDSKHPLGAGRKAPGYVDVNGRRGVPAASAVPACEWLERKRKWRGSKQQ
mmetsp:Transcript_12458/g.17024  ORF Transcript_12458/g.17024 Transcript_12458/m.17024 type:complete len:84 (-) Transcript_12458:53-304(-)